MSARRWATHRHLGVDWLAIQVLGVLLYQLTVGGHRVVANRLDRAAAHVGDECLELGQPMRFDLEVFGRAEKTGHGLFLSWWRKVEGQASVQYRRAFRTGERSVLLIVQHSCRYYLK